jgi:hypothetical protein
MTYFCKAKRLLINKMVTQPTCRNIYLLMNSGQKGAIGAQLL